MPYTVQGYETRAQECVELASQAKDALVRMELLKIRQTYLNIAERLRRQGFEVIAPDYRSPRGLQEMDRK
ncbi:MAG: hypothetical protein WDM91_02805 [Rhizomicrobium sp.]